MVSNDASLEVMFNRVWKAAVMNESPIVAGEEEGVTPTKEMTVGEVLDRRIERARKEVENLCITKAKADTLNLLNFPHSFITEIGW